MHYLINRDDSFNYGDWFAVRGMYTTLDAALMAADDETDEVYADADRARWPNDVRASVRAWDTKYVYLSGADLT